MLGIFIGDMREVMPRLYGYAERGRPTRLAASEAPTE